MKDITSSCTLTTSEGQIVLNINHDDILKQMKDHYKLSPLEPLRIVIGIKGVKELNLYGHPVSLVSD